MGPGNSEIENTARGLDNPHAVISDDAETGKGEEPLISEARLKLAAIIHTPLTKIEGSKNALLTTGSALGTVERHYPGKGVGPRCPVFTHREIGKGNGATKGSPIRPGYFESM